MGCLAPRCGSGGGCKGAGRLDTVGGVGAHRDCESTIVAVGVRPQAYTAEKITILDILTS